MKKLLSLLMSGAIIFGIAHTNAFAGGAFSTLKSVGSQAWNGTKRFFLGNYLVNMAELCDEEDRRENERRRMAQEISLEWSKIKTHADAIKYVKDKLRGGFNKSNIISGCLYTDSSSTEHTVRLEIIKSEDIGNYADDLHSDLERDTDGKLLFDRFGEEGFREFRAPYQLSYSYARALYIYCTRRNLYTAIKRKQYALKLSGNDMSRISYLVVRDMGEDTLDDDAYAPPPDLEKFDIIPLTMRDDGVFFFLQSE